MPLFLFHVIVQKPIHYYVNIFRKWKYKYFKLKSLVVSSWFLQMHFIYFANRQANGQWSFRFCSPPRIFFSSVIFVFWTSLSEITCRRLLLEQYFSFSVPSKFLTNWMIIHSSIFFTEIYYMIAYDYYTFTWLLWCIFLYMIFIF